MTKTLVMTTNVKPFTKAQLRFVEIMFCMASRVKYETSVVISIRHTYICIAHFLFTF